MDFSKPRVAIYYHVLPSTGFRSDGPPLFTNAALRRILHGVTGMSDMRKDMANDGGNVVHLWPDKRAEDFGKFQLHVWVDYGEDGLNIPLNWNPPSPSAYWVSDAHLGYDYRLSRAKKMDFVFCAQRVFMEKFEADGIPKKKLFYLPHCVEPTAYPAIEIINKWDWAFVGHLNSDKRVAFLDRLMKAFPNWYYGWRLGHIPGWNVLEDAARKYSQAKVVPNEAINQDLGMRVFEVMATKTALLQERVPDMAVLFEEGRHYLGWSTLDEAVDQMKYLLKHDTYRIQMAEAGYDEVLKKHTYQHRILEIFKKTIGWSPTEERHDIVQAGFARKEQQAASR